MCNFNLISGLIIAAQLAYLAVLALLGVATVNNTSLLAVAANGYVMAAAIIGCGGAAALFAAALGELNKCRGGACDAAIAPLAARLNSLAWSMGVLAGMLAAITLLTLIPFVGSKAIATIITWSMSVTAGVTVVVSLAMAQAILDFNACQARSGGSNNIVTARIVQVLAYVIFVVVAAEAGLGFEYKKIPNSLPPIG